ncbi:hypothetical protein BJX62DRAFT_244612 [Aspergillus germanicus]
MAGTDWLRPRPITAATPCARQRYPEGVLVLCGKVWEEYGGLDTSIYLDLLFDNNNEQLVKHGWSNSLLESVAIIDQGSDVLTFFLHSTNKKLAESQLSLADDLEYSNGCSRRRSDNSDFRGKFKDSRGWYYGIITYLKDDKCTYGGGWQLLEASFSNQFSNFNGKISTQDQ